jgi:hypothetical protein
MCFAGLVLAWSGLHHQASGQISAQMGEFDHVPQRVWANPALRPSGKINFGMPFLSQIYFEQSNNWFRPNEYIAVDDQGTGSVDYKRLLDDLDNEAFTGFGSTIELFHFGIRLGDEHYFHARIAERTQGGIGLPRDLFALALYGNAGSNGFENNTADLTNLRVDMMHFREYAIGYNYKFSDKLSLGLTAKYLYGMESIETEASSLKLYTDPLSYRLQSSGSLMLNTSGLGLGEAGRDIRSDVGNYLFGLKNRGLALDAGVVYHPIEKLRLECSLHDFGFISWREDVANYGTDDATFAYDGIDFTDFIFATGTEFDDALQNEIDAIADGAETAYNFDGTYKSYRTALFGYMRYAASYELFEKKRSTGRAWANVMHAVGHRNLPTRFSIGYNQQISKVLQLGLHYSKQAEDVGFIGGGISINGGIFQIYAMLENAQVARLSRYTMSDGGSGDSSRSVLLPQNPSDVRFHFGINLTINREEEKARGSAPLRR